MTSQKNRDGNLVHVAELFAGVGGFRHGLEQASKRFHVEWSNQWEPGTSRRQFASWCYEKHYANDGLHFNIDIAALLDGVENGAISLPPVDFVVGGFPCQDFSVAKPRNHSQGLRGRKGVLWWQIYRYLDLASARGARPRWVLLENVDRLLVSPSHQRGRDFAIILSALMSLGYEVHWRVINAADYGSRQKRRRVFILAHPQRSKAAVDATSIQQSVLTKAFPITDSTEDLTAIGLTRRLSLHPEEVSQSFSSDPNGRAFGQAGIARRGQVFSVRVTPRKEREQTLGQVVRATREVPPDYFVTSADALRKWKAVKGEKDVPKVSKRSGHTYRYREGNIPFPDNLNAPARTILTSEGGSSPARTKHIVKLGRRFRRLTPEELEALNGFPRGWTARGIRDGEVVSLTKTQRAFCMGNALVVGLVTRIGREIAALDHGT